MGDITASVSRSGNCWDTQSTIGPSAAFGLTLFGWLKVERLYGQRFAARRQARDKTIARLLWYNLTRRHSTLAYISPMQYEEHRLAAQAHHAGS